MNNPYSRYDYPCVCKFCNKNIALSEGMWVMLYPVELTFCSKECRDKFVDLTKEKKSA